MARSKSAAISPITDANSLSLPAQSSGSECSELSYEAALGELEQIVQRMEEGNLPLEESLEAYRRGSELLKYCQQQLNVAERKIQILENGVLRDFEPATGEAGSNADAKNGAEKQ
jgi:exodeoxyribonuclease VII small subunit